MTVYNVSGKLAVVGATKREALAVLRKKASLAEMDLFDEEVAPLSEAPVLTYFATGSVADLFEAESETAAMARFMNWTLGRAGTLPSGVSAFESEDVPKEWVR